MPSIIEQLAELPLTGLRTHEAQGKILLFPRTGIIGVPFDRPGRGWDVCIIEAPSADSPYQPGGWHIFVGDAEIERAVQVAIQRPEALNCVPPVPSVPPRKEP